MIKEGKICFGLNNIFIHIFIHFDGDRCKLIGAPHFGERAENGKLF